MYPVVAIVGRPNVGKSTLFNLLIGERKAITAKEAGTTRDRIYAKGYIGESRASKGQPCMLVDTGGIEMEKGEVLEGKMRSQAQTAIAEADVILLLVDSREELTQADYEAVEIIRKSSTPVILIASKCDSGLSDTSEFASLGFGMPVEVSTFHKTGLDELEKQLLGKFGELGFKETEEEGVEGEDEMIKIAFVGRPNVGKSSLLNAYFDDEKVIVSEIAGTTRDAADFELDFKDDRFLLIDTAGIRRRGAVEVGIEKFSVARSLQALDKADIAVLLLDAREGITRQDMHIADYILKSKTGLIIAINKTDLLDKGEEPRDEWLSNLHYKFDFTPWAAAVFISAVNKKNIEQLLEIAVKIKEERGKRIPTRELNLFLQECMIKHAPTGASRSIPKALYFTQVDIHPPHFVLFVNNKEWFHFSYYRYVENQLRKRYGFEGTPVRLEMKSKEARD
jgi:GTP-binding protein